MGYDLGAKHWFLEEASVYALAKFIDNKWGDQQSNCTAMIKRIRGKRFDELQPNSRSALLSRLSNGLCYMVNIM